MPVTTKSNDELRKEYLFRELWGFEKVPTPANVEIYAKALLAACNADGELADEERNYVLGMVAGMGAEPGLVDQLRNYPATEEVQDLVTRDPAVRASSRALIFDAIRACSADGVLHPRELAKIYDIAQLLDVPREVVDELQSVYHEQRRITGKLFRAAYPDPKNRPY
ncbi:hypothetical protein [Streptomyces sclerotialus]|uniref:hypothetical protein n=1 Tax=Streptomyces sclerotialus TaxID=1957 RepID=UPI000690D069